jgi:hypothetical protein
LLCAGRFFAAGLSALARQRGTGPSACFRGRLRSHRIGLLKQPVLTLRPAAAWSCT